MNPSENKKNLDELLSKTVGHSPLKFDFDTWKKQHVQEIAEYRATCKSGASLTNKRTTKMKSLILKFAVAAGILIATLTGIGLFDNWFGGNNVAFAEVLKNFQNRNYSFELVLVNIEGDKQNQRSICQAIIKEPGWMRCDYTTTAPEIISSVTDFNSGKTLVLFHQNKSAMLMENPLLNINTGAEGIVGLGTKSVSALWNLKDGTEKTLGSKEVDGQKVAGFAVSQEDSYFQYQMSIWARVDDSTPCLVEVNATSKQEKPTQIGWTMQKFVMDVQCDDSQFSLETPAGYTLAFQKKLDDMPVKGDASPAARKIEDVLNLWAEGKKDPAVEILLGMDWTLPLTFDRKPYIFTTTEQEYIILKPEDQKKVIEDVMASSSVVKEIARHLVAQGQTAIAVKENDKAQKYYTAGNHLGQLLSKDPDRMLITRMVGIAVQKMMLNELVKLYTQTNNQEELQATQKQLQTVTEMGAEIKRKVTGK